MSTIDHLSELESLRSQVADLAYELAARDQSMQVQHQSFEHVMQDLRAQSDLLKTIMEGTAADTGDEFFASLATHLTATLHMQYAVIGEIVDGTPVTVHTLAVASGEALLDNFKYDLTQAPCGTALTESFWCYEQGVQALFSHFPPLATLGVQSHSGVSIRNKQGDVVGLIVVMDTKRLRIRSGCSRSSTYLPHALRQNCSASTPKARSKNKPGAWLMSKPSPISVAGIGRLAAAGWSGPTNSFESSVMNQARLPRLMKPSWRSYCRMTMTGCWLP